MPSPTLLTYDYDPTGLNPTNLVVNELHNVSLNARAFVVNYGPFFEQGLIVKSGVDGTPLTPILDYSVAVIYENATLATGKAVFCFIVINNLSLTSVSVTYQTIGGEYAFYTTPMADLLETISLDDRPVEWGSLLGLPSGFTPAPHMHPASQIYNWGGFISKLEEIRQAILLGDQPAMDELRDWVTDQVSGAAAPVASNEEAIQGVNLVKRITPSNLKAALDARIADLDLATFDFEVDSEDDDWGFWRHKESGFTVCWGVTSSVVSGGAYRAYFRRRFDFKPVITGSSSVVTTDTTPSGTQWVELTASVAEHTVSNESFYIAANRINGTGNDAVRFRYIAVGHSSDAQPLATSSGIVATIPPTGATVTVPSWSGSFTTYLQTPATGNYRMGIVFPAGVVGGGHTFNVSAQTQLSQFFYTLYPGLFNDALYEIKGSILSTTFAPNLTYTGLTLDTWIDLSTVKAMDASLLESGFTWTTTGLYGGVVTLEVIIRLKSNPTTFASRIFTFDRDSTAYRPAIGYNGIQLGLGFISGSVVPSALNLVAVNPNYVGLELQNAGSFGGFNGNATQALVRDGTNTPITQAELVDYEARLWYANNGMGRVTVNNIQPTTSLDVTDNLNWTSCDSLVMPSNQPNWTLTVDNGTSTTNGGGWQYHLRHKTDRRKVCGVSIGAWRVGAERIPVWSGSTSAASTVPAAGGGLVLFDIIFPTNQTAGTGYWQIQRTYGGNTYTTTGNFTYSLGQGSWSDQWFATRAVNVSSTGSSFSSSSNLGFIYRMDSGEIKYSWSGNVTTASTLEIDVTVSENDLGPIGATATQRFVLNITTV